MPYAHATGMLFPQAPMPRANVTTMPTTNSTVSAPEMANKGHHRREAVQLTASRRVESEPSSSNSCMTGYGSSVRRAAASSRRRTVDASACIDCLTSVRTASEIPDARHRPEILERAEGTRVLRETHDVARWIGERTENDGMG